MQCLASRPLTGAATPTPCARARGLDVLLCLRLFGLHGLLGSRLGLALLLLLFGIVRLDFTFFLCLPRVLYGGCFLRLGFLRRLGLRYLILFAALRCP